MNFTDKVVIITGASSGIGNALSHRLNVLLIKFYYPKGAGAAEHFSKLDANLVLTGRNEDKLKKTVEKCIGKGEILSVVSDSKIEADRERIVNETVKKFGRIDVLVNKITLGSDFVPVFSILLMQ